MKLHMRAFAAALGAVAMLSLAACNGGGSSVNPFSPSRGTMRFINGSPDAGNVNVAVGTANQPNFTSVPYAGGAQSPATSNPGITAYVQFNAPTQNIFIYNSTTGALITVPQKSITITPSGRQTVVLTGSAAKGTLRLASFSEHLFKTVAGAGSVAFHHASEAFATTQYTVGYQAATSSTKACTSPFATIPPPVIFGVSPPTFQEGVPPAPSGVVFCAQGGGALISLFPSQVDSNNTGNVMPFTGTGSVNSDQNLSIYLIDPPAGTGHPVMVGVFDPDN